MMPQMPQGGGMPQAGGGNFLQALMSLGQGGQQGGPQGGAPGSTAQLMCPNCHGPITVSIAPAQGGGGMPPMGGGMGGGMPQMGGRPGSTF